MVFSGYPLEMISEHPPKKSQSVSSQYLKILYKQFLIFINKILALAFCELPIVLSRWASCFIDLVTYYLHRR